MVSALIYPLNHCNRKVYGDFRYCVIKPKEHKNYPVGPTKYFQ